VSRAGETHALALDLLRVGKREIDAAAAAILRGDLTRDEWVAACETWASVVRVVDALADRSVDDDASSLDLRGSVAEMQPARLGVVRQSEDVRAEPAPLGGGVADGGTKGARAAWVFETPCPHGVLIAHPCAACDRCIHGISSLGSAGQMCPVCRSLEPYIPTTTPGCEVDDEGMPPSLYDSIGDLFDDGTNDDEEAMRDIDETMRDVASWRARR
jgi:hypothetical protein